MRVQDGQPLQHKCANPTEGHETPRQRGCQRYSCQPHAAAREQLSYLARTDSAHVWITRVVEKEVVPDHDPAGLQHPQYLRGCGGLQAGIHDRREYRRLDNDVERGVSPREVRRIAHSEVGTIGSATPMKAPGGSSHPLLEQVNACEIGRRGSPMYEIDETLPLSATNIENSLAGEREQAFASKHSQKPSMQLLFGEQIGGPADGIEISRDTPFTALVFLTNAGYLVHGPIAC